MSLSAWWNEHNVDQLSRKLIRHRLRLAGFESPYDLRNPDAKKIVVEYWKGICERRANVTA